MFLFLHRVAAGLVFLAGAAVSRMGITSESWLLLTFGFSTCVAGMAWLTAGPSPERPVVLRA